MIRRDKEVLSTEAVYCLWYRSLIDPKPCQGDEVKRVESVEI